MKSILSALLVICSALFASAQAQPDHVLVLTKTSSATVDSTETEFVQELDLHETPESQQISCLLTHPFYCGTSYVDLSVAPKTAVSANVLELLRRSSLCSLDPVAVHGALAKARFRATALSDVAWTIVAQCGSRQVVLEIPDSVDVNQKKLRHASKETGALFDFAQEWTRDHAQKEKSCPAEWKEPAEPRAHQLLDDFHASAMEKSSAYNALRQNNVNQIPRSAFIFKVDVNRAVFEKYSDPLPSLLETSGIRDLSLDVVADVDGATGKLAGIEKENLTPQQAAFMKGVRRAAASWQFRPNIPSQVPMHVTFQCTQK